MAKMIWDNVGEKYYETGVEQCALFVYDKNILDKAKRYANGVPWNGLTGVTEKPSGAEVTDLWANDAKYGSMIAAEKFGCSIEAYTYPKEWLACDGIKELAPGAYVGQQNRATFGLAYKTLIGNDEDNLDHGYKLHLIYGCLASPSEKARKTVNESPEAVTFTWEVSTTPVNANVLGLKLKPTSYIELDSRDFEDDQWYKLQMLEDIIYGKVEYQNGVESKPYLPLPDEVNRILLTSANIQSIRLVSLPKKLMYYVGEPFDPAGLFVVARYDNGVELDIDDYAISQVDTSEVGTQTVTVTFETMTASFNVEVRSRTYTGIEIGHLPNKTTYVIGDEFDTTGLVVYGLHRNGTKIPLNLDDCIITGFDSTTIGAKIIDVNYTGFHASFEVTVTEVQVTRIEITQLPDKTVYFVDEPFDKTGIVVSAVYNTDPETISPVPLEECTFENIDTHDVGFHDVTVHWQDFEAIFQIEVIERTIINVDLVSPPTKTSYIVGEELDTTGLTLKVFYDDETSVDVTEGFECTGFDSSVPVESQIITVDYAGFTVTFTVTITEA